MSVLRPRHDRTFDARRAVALAGLAVVGLLTSGAGTALAQPPLTVAGFGFDVDLPSAAAAAEALPDVRGREVVPAVLRVTVPWRPASDRSGTLDALDRALASAEARGASVVLVLVGPGPEGRAPGVDGEAMDAWLSFVTAVAEKAAGRARAYQVWDRANEAASWGAAPSVANYAFLLKRTALAIRSADPRAVVAQGALAPSPTFQSDLFAEGVAAFLDAYGLDLATTGDAETAARRGLEAMRAGDPGAALWLHGLSLEGAPGPAAWEAGLQARERDAELVTHVLPPLGPDDASGVLKALDTLSRAFPADAVPAVVGGRPIVSFPDEARVQHAAHVVASDLSSRVAYRTRARPLPGTRVIARVMTSDAENFRLFDPTGEHEGPVTKLERQPGRGQVALEIPLPQRSLVLAFDRRPDEDAVEEQLSVAGRQELSVEEILARHLAVQAGRDRLLRQYTCDIETTLRYELGATRQAVEVRVEGRYYHDAHGEKEVENLRFFLNGARYDPKKRIPELPLLQPEKVTVVPLDVHLDRTYEYELAGRDTIAGRPAYEVAFRPLPGGTSRFAGKVWIDAGTFDRLRLQQVQTGLEAPVTSNEQVDRYGPVEGADGAEHWLVTESDTHRVVSVLGASVVVHSHMAFSGFQVNGEGFDEALEAAHASPHQMLRETDEGFQYLRPTEDGGREVAPTSTRKVLAVVGARVDSSYETVLPLGGVNWLENDFRGTGIQANLFLAGAINTVSLADPSLWGSRLEGSVDLFAPFIGRRDRPVLPGTPLDEGGFVKVREPSVEVGLGIPAGRFGKVVIESELSHQDWRADDDTAADFVVPNDGLVSSLGVTAELHRKGVDLRGGARRWHRHDWQPWGPDGGAPDPLGFEPGDEDYWTWRASAGGSWFFKKAQTFSVSADWYDGSGLDRFSQYEFSGLGGPQLAGFAGSGIHFDQAALLRLAYGLDVAGLFGLKAHVEGGRVKNESLPDALREAFGETEDLVGIGVTGTVPGPWGTVVTFEVGHALSAGAYDRAEGDLVGQVLVLKLLK